MPSRKANDAIRTRSHLTEGEINKLLTVTKAGRYGQRDHLMILMAFRHGLRCSKSEWPRVLLLLTVVLVFEILSRYFSWR